MEQHLKHIDYLEALLAKESPNTDAWWRLKERLTQVRIAWGQSVNCAVQMINGFSESKKSNITDAGIKGEIEVWQSYFYEKLTAPLTHKLKEEFEASQKSKKGRKEKIGEQEI